MTERMHGKTLLRHHLITLMVAAACTTACEKKPAPPIVVNNAPEDTRGATFAQDSLRDWFIDSSVADIPDAEAEIIAMFGTADSVVRLPSANRQDPAAYDTIIEIHYPTLAATILKVGSNETLQSVWTSDSTHIIGPIRIGTDTSTLRRLLGGPMLFGDHPGYVCGKCTVPNESVRFDLVDGKVTGMLFEFPGS